MSQLAPNRGHASADAAAREDHPRSPPQVDDSTSATGRFAHPPLIPSLGSQRSPALRSPRPTVPSPLSTTSNIISSSAHTSPRHPPPSLALKRPSAPDLRSADHGSRLGPAGHTTFYSDSSNSSTPEEELARLNFDLTPNDGNRSVSDPVTARPDQDVKKGVKSSMASAVAAAPGGLAAGLPRSSSMDTAISNVSTKPQAVSQNEPLNGLHKTSDIANLIKTAGSPEAVIQYLLKEKNSQSQQNSQLWRLVDKQRAMILGLNKDLEAALKDKEKYRKKLKEVVASSTTLKATGSQHAQKDAHAVNPAIPRVDAQDSGRDKNPPPDSPIADSDSQKNSPIEVAMAPYPITPPADRLQESPSGVAELLDPAHAMPKPQEHAKDHFNHDAEEEAAERARKEKGEAQLRDIPYNASLPPSRSLPSEPPKMPPPNPPSSSAPPPPVLESPSPQTSKGLSQFPSPPRKAPPAPLQLKKDSKRSLDTSAVDDDSESDYDDILEVNEIAHHERGRRKTREEDDRERGVLAFKEAEARSVSKKSKSSDTTTLIEEAATSSHPMPPVHQEASTASLNAVVNGHYTRDLIAPPLMSPGLPASPRPMGNMKHHPLHSPPLTSRGGPLSLAAGPLSPRQPRQPIPLPPNTPLSSPPPPSSGQVVDAPPLSSSTRSGDSPTERTKVYKGLVTEEYPDLLLPPNALPSIDLKVASSRMKPSRASLLSLTQLEEDPVFTLAVISRSDRGELWRVEKDSLSLAKLDQRLKQCPAFTARTPDRSLFSGHSPAKLDARRIALDQYLDELLNSHLDTNTAVELCKYLSSNTLPPNADETGSAAPSTAQSLNHKKGPDGRPIRSGYLTKRGKNFGGWKARFFTIDGPHLKYFETPGGAHLGTIKLQNAQIGKQSHTADNQSPARANAGGEELDNQYRHAFLILEPKKKDSTSHVKHVLCAENDKERDLWVDALLYWIDYRDPDDTEQRSGKGSVHDRQASGASEPSAGSKPKKSHQGRAPQQSSDSDALIGVRYDSTHAGDVPQGAPGGRKNSAGSSEQFSTHSISGDTLVPQSNILISGPKDPQVISDSSAWGNKLGLGVPSHEEKKQRKRSFFGFGPKARSSSEGQESLFGGSDTAHANPYHPIRQVFGAPLAEAVRYNHPVDVNVPLPSVVYRCIQYLDSKDAVLEEGIFRLSGSNVVIKQLRERFNTEGDINLVTDDQYYDIHAVASLLKLYLRELPTTILTRDLHMEFLRTTEMPDRTEKLAALSELAQRLPQANATLLKYLIAFLINIINNADMNKMTVRNVGIVFSPTLNIPAPVFAMLLQNYEGIFGIAPEEYELPLIVPEPENQGHYDPTRGFEPPPRPSTSSGSASPHRQPRMDSMREHMRTTPTPPLLTGLNAARGSPTPYEPAYIGKQNTPVVASRPAYENSFGRPGVHDNGHHVQPQSRGVPAYDRPAYPQGSEELLGAHGSLNTPAYDQSSGTSTSNKRRESSIFGHPTGLQQRSSNGHLREESLF